MLLLSKETKSLSEERLFYDFQRLFCKHAFAGYRENLEQ